VSNFSDSFKFSKKQVCLVSGQHFATQEDSCTTLLLYYYLINVSYVIFFCGIFKKKNVIKRIFNYLKHATTVYVKRADHATFSLFYIL